MINAYKSLFSCEGSFEVVFARRQTNKVAHSLADQAAFVCVCSAVWAEAPNFIGDLLHEDCTSSFSYKYSFVGWFQKKERNESNYFDLIY